VVSARATEAAQARALRSRTDDERAGTRMVAGVT
jgi:hypothetical protein